jgi:DNA (cytosine-5)-methyltransferase 1
MPVATAERVTTWLHTGRTVAWIVTASGWPRRNVLATCSAAPAAPRTGAIGVPGVTIRMAANHWQLAVDTHNTNHPGADHSCADISQVDPRRFPRTDLLWASPECTNHSQAKGRARDVGSPTCSARRCPTRPPSAPGRPCGTSSASPSTTATRRHRRERRRRLPLAAVPGVADGDGLLGYEHQLVCLNSMHAQAGGLPAPQSRDRMYVVFWRKGNRRSPTSRSAAARSAWCPRCDEVVAAVQAWKNPAAPWAATASSTSTAAPTPLPQPHRRARLAPRLRRDRLDAARPAHR